MKKLLLSLVLAVGMMNVQIVNASENSSEGVRFFDTFNPYKSALPYFLATLIVGIVGGYSLACKENTSDNRDKIYQEGYQKGREGMVSEKIVNDQLSIFFNSFDKQLYPEIKNKSITNLTFGSGKIIIHSQNGSETVETYVRLQNQKSMYKSKAD